LQECNHINKQELRVFKKDVMKQMTSNDYAKELRDLKRQQNALKNRIILRAGELIKENPDIMIQLSCFINSYKASQLNFTKDTDVDTALKIIQTIEAELAKQHPHKQTKIEFPSELQSTKNTNIGVGVQETHHTKLMNIAKGIQALNIPKSKS